MFMYNKGAMFGLDARIALAIFGALSVISGAALYSAIQQSKVVKNVTYLEEVAKGLEQHILDVGYFPENNSGNKEIGVLAANYKSEASWNGPYIGEDTGFSTSLKLNNLTGDSSIDSSYRLKAVVEGNTVSLIASCDGKICNYFLVRSLAKSSATSATLIEFTNSLDEYVDNGDGGTTGKVQFVDTGTDFWFGYKLMPYLQ